MLFNPVVLSVIGYDGALPTTVKCYTFPRALVELQKK